MADLNMEAERAVACSSCGLTMEESRWLATRRAPAVVGDDGLPPLPAQHEELQACWKCEDCDGRGYTGEWLDQGYFQPPEPERCGTCESNGSIAIEAYTAEQVRQAQRDAIAANHLERANIGGRTVINPDGSTSTLISEYENHLENDLASIRDLFPKPDCGDELHNLWSEACSEPRAVVAYVKAQFAAIAADRAARAQQQAQSIDTPEFREIIARMLNEYWESESHIAALIAYIDGRTAGAAPELYTCKGKGGTYELIGHAWPAGVLSSTLMVSSYPVYRDTKRGQLFVRTVSDFEQRMERIAAAPSPQPGKEGVT